MVRRVLHELSLVEPPPSPAEPVQKRVRAAEAVVVRTALGGVEELKRCAHAAVSEAKASSAHFAGRKALTKRDLINAAV